MDMSIPTAVLKPRDPEKISAHAGYASYVIRDNIAEIQGGSNFLPNEVKNADLVPIKSSLYDGEDKDKDRTFKVGIVGAGAAGLFTTMVFDHLTRWLKENKNIDFKVECEIMESSDRVGGRLYTHNFPLDRKPDEPEQPYHRHQYYDVGAMRFPEIEIMKRTFELFRVLKMDKDTTPEPAKGNLRPYYMKGGNTPLLYNDVRIVPEPKPKSPSPTQEQDSVVSADRFKITGLPEDIAKEDAGKLVDDEIEVYRGAYEKLGPQKFWKYLMNRGDRFTVRQYLSLVANFSYNTIEWLETANFGNRWYDQAFSEMILEDLDFNHKGDWWCIEGGSSEIAHRMRDALEEKKQNRIQYGKSVVQMDLKAVGEQDPNDALKNREVVEVRIQGEDEPRQYDAVFNSAPLGAMQRMKLEGLSLNWGTKQAIRSLGYGASCKVGIQFSNMWWRNDKLGLNIFEGGVSKTDLPLRCCVYPSYNVNDPVDKPAVLLVSYTWSQEASRLGALINRQSPQSEEQLRETLIHDLTRLHAVEDTKEAYDRLREAIESSYITHYAYDWSTDPHVAGGAFAYFGPQQFSCMYPWITRNNGKHIIIGEAASAHHAWVVGSLESAVRGVYQFLFRHSRFSKACHEAIEAYNDGKIEKPYGPLPAELDRTNDIDLMKTDAKGAEHAKRGTVRLAAEGEFARQQVLFEMVRIKQGGDQIVPESIKKEEILPILQASQLLQAKA